MMKNVLLITPDFFDYHVSIKAALIEQGYAVKWYSDRPNGGFFTKSMIRLNKKILEKKIRKYFDIILEDASKNQYSHVFVVFGQSFTSNMFKELKTKLPEAKFLYYTWDSIKVFPEIVEKIDFFDVAFSFDPTDCRNNEKFIFLPLFYEKEYVKLKELDESNEVLYVGTAKPGKYKLLKSMVNELEISAKYKVVTYFYMQSKILYWFYKLTSKEFRYSKQKDFVFKKMSKEKLLKAINNASIILDIPQKGQEGLTMRTIETLGAKRKLITTNENIINYDFYKKENHYIYTLGTPFDFDNIFFNHTYENTDLSIYEKYSINEWVKRIINSI